MAVIADEVWAEDALRAYAASLYPAALRMVGNPPDADDFMRETFAKALAASERPLKDSATVRSLSLPVSRSVA